MRCFCALFVSLWPLAKICFWLDNAVLELGRLIADLFISAQNSRDKEKIVHRLRFRQFIRTEQGAFNTEKIFCLNRSCFSSRRT